MRQIEKPSFLYSVLFSMVKFYFHLYYRKITISGKGKVPLNAPLIFASNHQNALMDALAILFAANRPVVFLARADIFKNKKVARILNFLKILPVYRIRDGVDSMGNNSQTFNQTIKILASGTPLGILPEGAHSPVKKLLQLKKGICRIAFNAEESSDFKLNIQIIPVGLDYTNPRQAGTHLMINFGDPIAVSAYYNQFRNNPQKAIGQLRDDIAAAMKSVMIHIENEEHYHSILSLTRMLETDYLKSKGLVNNRINRFFATREIIWQAESAVSDKRLDIDSVTGDLAIYKRMLKQNCLKDNQLSGSLQPIRMTVISVFVSLLLCPVHMYGMIVNYIPYKIPAHISGKIKDPQFISSVNFGLSFFLFPVWYFVLFIAIQLLHLTLPVDLLLLLSWPVSGLFSFYYFKYFRKLISRWRFHVLRKKNPTAFRKITELRKKIIDSSGLIF